MLFDPARHERLLPVDWDEHRVRATITRIARDIEDRFSEAAFWPLHPLDLEEGDDPNLPGTTLYCGACEPSSMLGLMIFLSCPNFIDNASIYN